MPPRRVVSCMPLDRRDFLATAASLAAGAALGPGEAHAALPPGHPAGSDDDPLGVRADFPITATRTYLNTAYIAPIPKPVAAAVQAFNEKRMNDPLSVGDLLRQVGATKGKFAKFINAQPDEMALLYTTSEGRTSSPTPSTGRRVTTSWWTTCTMRRRSSSIVSFEARHRVELRIVKSRNGAAEAADYEPLVDARTRLVSIAWVSSVNGYRHDVRAIAEVAHAKGALVYVDAIQALGMFPVDVQAAGIDVLCCGTYKWLMSGFGVAPFYVRKAVQDRIRPDRFGAFSVADELPDHRFTLRQGMGAFTYATLPFAEVYQLSAALDYLQKVGVARIEGHTTGLAVQLRDGLVKQGYKLLTPPGNRSSIITFGIRQDSKALADRLANARIDVTVRETEVRVSPALFSTAEGVDHFLTVLGRA